MPSRQRRRAERARQNPTPTRRSRWKIALAVLGGIVVSLGIGIPVAHRTGRYTRTAAAPKALYVRGGELFDGASGLSVPNPGILIKGEKIRCLGCPMPDGAEVVDASELAILPGFIDAHVHLTFPSGHDYDHPALLPLWMPWDMGRYRPAARKALQAAGITAIRTMGDFQSKLFEISDLIYKGELEGPRSIATGPMFTAPGGHPICDFLAPMHLPKDLVADVAREVATADDARAKVRELADTGKVAGIKVVYDRSEMATRVSACPVLPKEVLAAIVDEAHRANLWVAVHTGTVEDVVDAVALGADSIEHGITDGQPFPSETLAQMAERQVLFVPTLAILSSAWEHGLTPDKIERRFKRPEAAQAMKELAARGSPVPKLMENVHVAWKAGVPIGAGSDTCVASTFLGETFDVELEKLVEAGLSPTAALLAGGRNVALAMRAPGLGTIAPGAEADLVLVRGRPWERISDVRNVAIVVQGGRVVVQR